MKGIIINIFF